MNKANGDREDSEQYQQDGQGVRRDPNSDDDEIIQPDPNQSKVSKVVSIIKIPNVILLCFSKHGIRYHWQLVRLT